MESFSIADFLKSIVGGENYRLDQAKVRFEYAKSKSNDQVTAVWALVLAVLYLEEGHVKLAQDYLEEGSSAVTTVQDAGLHSLYDYLKEKTVELSACSSLSH